MFRATCAGTKSRVLVLFCPRLYTALVLSIQNGPQCKFDPGAPTGNYQIIWWELFPSSKKQLKDIKNDLLSLRLTQQFITFILEAIYNLLLMMKSFHASWTLQSVQKPSFNQRGAIPDSMTYSSHYANNWLHVTHTTDMTFPEHKIQIEIFNQLVSNLLNSKPISEVLYWLNGRKW